MYPKQRSEASQLRIAVVSVARRMIGSSYRLGGMNHEVGFDCFSYWYYFYSQIGVNLPQEEGLYDLGNYASRYAADKEGAKAAMIGFIRSLVCFR
ncbi:MAG: NlpC/P60 family protein [bacterium]